MLKNWFENTLYPDIALLLSRLLVAGIFIYHGLPKSMNWGMAMEKFIGMGFPGFLGPVVGIVEVVCGIALVIGLFTRLNSIILGIVIFVAIVGVQAPGAYSQGTLLTAGLERDLLILTSLLVILGFGPGRLSADG